MTGRPAVELDDEKAQEDLNTKLYAAAAAGDAAAVSEAVDAGADVAAIRGEGGTTPLMAAAEGGHEEVVRALLEAGAPWNAQDDDGFTAGEYAARSPAIAELLLEWGVQAELLLGAAEREQQQSAVHVKNAAYLSQRLCYTPDGTKLLDADGEAVMMGWETPLMQRHAAAICGAKRGTGDFLNVGFGLGIIDREIQSYCPHSHTIIEAHPDVYAHMLAEGWGDRPGVTLLHGRWQDVLSALGTFDGIFFDTYGEYYEELRAFHCQLPRLLRPGGVYSYFNGLASDNLFFHSVYGRLVQVELGGLGLETRFEQLAVAELGDDVWQGVRSRYWQFPCYFLPIVKHASPTGDGSCPSGSRGDSGDGDSGGNDVPH